MPPRAAIARSRPRHATTDAQAVSDRSPICPVLRCRRVLSWLGVASPESADEGRTTTRPSRTPTCRMAGYGRTRRSIGPRRSPARWNASAPRVATARASGSSYAWSRAHVLQGRPRRTTWQPRLHLQKLIPPQKVQAPRRRPPDPGRRRPRIRPGPPRRSRPLINASPHERRLRLRLEPPQDTRGHPGIGMIIPSPGTSPR